MGDPFEKWHKELWESDRDPKTKAKYWQVLTAYQSWLKGREPDVPTAKEFISYLREKGYAQGTLLVYKHGLSPFFESMGQTLKIKLKKHHSLPKYHDRGDVERLISKAEKGLYRHTRDLKERNTAIIVTLAYSGIRRGELVSLRVNDLDFQRRTILVRQGKGNRDRVVPMHERLVPHLRGQCSKKGAQEKFLNRGIERWEAERRLSSSEAALLRSQVASGESRNAMHHMGVHLVLSVALVIPIPGLRSLARFTWTAIFWVKVQAGRLLRRGPKTAVRVSNIHSPLVMVLALVPLLGGVAYMASRPLRRKALIRLMLDQIAIKLLFRLYTRLNLGKGLAPVPTEPEHSMVSR